MLASEVTCQHAHPDMKENSATLAVSTMVYGIQENKQMNACSVCLIHRIHGALLESAFLFYCILQYLSMSISEQLVKEQLDLAQFT